MRLDRISRLALAASLGLSGCSTYRPYSGLDSYQPLRELEPPRHASEFHPHGGSSNWSDQRTAPAGPHVPPAAPAKRVSQVKSVGLLRDTTPPCADPCTTDCTPEGCIADQDYKPSCLTRIFGKPTRSLKKLFGCDHSPVGCSSEAYTSTDSCTTGSACTTTPSGNWSSGADSSKAGTAESNSVSAPSPNNADQWKEDRARLQSNRPSLAEAMHDPFLDLENNRFGDNASPFDAFPQNSSYEQQPAGRNPFDVPEESWSGHSFADPESRDTSRQTPSAGRPPASIPSAGVPSAAPPVFAPEDNENGALPLWPRLRQTPEVTESSPEVRPAVPRSASTSAAEIRPDAPLPQIMARERF